MNELKVLGQEKIGQYEFTGIEGGFGEDKRAMLVRDIAVIHNLETRTVNQTINRNIKRFKTGIDILDLKQITRSDVFSEYGFNKAQWGNANNIYMLSERGYAKLLKILEDDTAWDIYDELVDNYFNMRQAIKADNKALVANKRLTIMEENAKTRKANQLGIKAEQPGQNRFGRWANSKSRYSDKEVAQWLYSEDGLNAIRKGMIK